MGQDAFDFDEEFTHKAFKDDPTPAHKLYRRDDPDTSREAAYSIQENISGLELAVYQVICAHGSEGCISDQVRYKFPELSYSSVTARYKALMDKGWIRDTGRREPGESGRNQRVMVATKYFTEDKKQ